MTPRSPLFRSGLRFAALALGATLCILPGASGPVSSIANEPAPPSSLPFVYAAPPDLQFPSPTATYSPPLRKVSRLRSRPVSVPPVARASLPPMGWNGYNYFFRSVTAGTVEAEARTLVSSGMKAAGYRYVIVDGGWSLPYRSSTGLLLPDPSKFPKGIKPVADYVHSLGLKFGIYTSAGSYNCFRTSAGSYGHYAQDAMTFASWGVDYVKLDWCNIPYWSFSGWAHWQVSRYLASQMSYQLRASGRSIILDVNDWTGDGPWNWAPPLASLWRVPADIQDTFGSVLSNFLLDVRYPRSARPGAFNDPDMLEVGNGGMSTVEYQTQFSLWAMLAAPLIAGTDVSSMSSTTRSILTNLAVIAVDQDRLGRQATVVASADGHWVLLKPLADGSRAVLFFDQASAPATVSVPLAELGFAGPVHLLDLWSGQPATASGAISASVLGHGVVMYKVWS